MPKKVVKKQDQKKQIISKHGVHPKDTGSPQVQIAILTWEINHLSDHLKGHPKDDHSRRGLFKKVADRRKLLNYLKLNKKEDYESILEELKLRK